MVRVEVVLEGVPCVRYSAQQLDTYLRRLALFEKEGTLPLYLWVWLE